MECALKGHGFSSSPVLQRLGAVRSQASTSGSMVCVCVLCMCFHVVFVMGATGRVETHLFSKMFGVLLVGRCAS